MGFIISYIHVHTFYPIYYNVRNMKKSYIYVHVQYRYTLADPALRAFLKM